MQGAAEIVLAIGGLGEIGAELIGLPHICAGQTFS
jgi:hypothetical protein